MSNTDTAATRTPAQQLRRVLVLLADGNFRGYSQIYERIARCWADDPDLLARTVALAADPQRPGNLPVAILAAVHDLTLRAPDSPLARCYAGDQVDPWPVFRDTLAQHFDEVAELVRTRSIQTNEVGRSAVIIPSLSSVVAELGNRPLALIEVGPSAGLNLYADRYHTRYSDGRDTGPASSTVQLTCELQGPNRPPLPDGPPPTIASRQGIDLAPIDVLDPVATRWLEACLWPDTTDRAERLRAALDLARSEPPLLHVGDATTDLGPLIDELPAEVLPVVFATWALAYLSREGRTAVHDAVAQRGARRDLALLTMEYPHVIPWIPEARPAAVDEGVDATLLGLACWRDGIEHDRALAWCHAHGRWIDWLDEGAER